MARNSRRVNSRIIVHKDIITYRTAHMHYSYNNKGKYMDISVVADNNRSSNRKATASLCIHLSYDVTNVIPSSRNS